MPDPVPAGYLPDGIDMTGKQKWTCASRYEGIPDVKCDIGDDCVAAYIFEGCVPQYLGLELSAIGDIYN
jgi:hypothetical protein